MDAQAIIFYMIAAFILGTAILSVTTAKIFRSAIWLLSSLIGIAALYFWMHLEFIAAVQIIVYVGGIVVLIIFSIFLTQQAGNKMPAPMMKRWVFAVLASLSGMAFTIHLIGSHAFNPMSTIVFTPEVDRIGRQMLSPAGDGFILPFEVISMLLLAAMVGCIVIAMKSPAGNESLSQREKGDDDPGKKGEVTFRKPSTNESTVEEVL
jgi:NADH-quinone oxidoreductase subunit J